MKSDAGMTGPSPLAPTSVPPSQHGSPNGEVRQLGSFGSFGSFERCGESGADATEKNRRWTLKHMKKNRCILGS